MLPEHRRKIEDMMFVDDKLGLVVVRDGQARSRLDIEGGDKLLLEFEIDLRLCGLQAASTRLHQIESGRRPRQDTRRDADQRDLSINMYGPRIILVNIVQIA